MTILPAQTQHIDLLAPLFDAYRVFYKQNSDLAASHSFLLERLQLSDSVIFIAFSADEAIGFTQLYPLFSSVSLEPMYLLNDLYIDVNFRDKGIGTALIEFAKNYCRQNKHKGLAIQTAFENPAQHLYQRLGFEKDSDLHFFWTAQQ